jgi:hypothetical protein
MLILLAIPVLFAVTAMHRYIQSYAPTNLLTRRVRAQEPRWTTAAVLTVLVAALLVVMHMLGEAVADGGPGWLNFAVLMLAWDAIKVAVLTLSVMLRAIAAAARRGMARGPRVPQASS